MKKMNSVRCRGENKFFQRCPRYIMTDADEALCWEHVAPVARVHEPISHAREWQPIRVTKDVLPEVRQVTAASDRLKELVSDEENVHTPEVQVGMNLVIRKLEEWAKKHNIQKSKDLAVDVLNATPNPTPVQSRAIEHLMNCYQFTDTTKMFGTTYPYLASWVWSRIHQHHEHKDTLIQRFYEEVSESAGECLNGNMVRLMNVFAALDPDLSYQSSPSHEFQMSALAKEVEEGLPIRAAMYRAEKILNRAGIYDRDMDPWLEVLCDAGKDIADARMYNYYYGSFE